MTDWFKQPLLAAKIDGEADYAKLRYPMLVSSKLDGIRAYSHPQLGLVSRTLKQIPNAYIQEVLKPIRRMGFDGELFVGNETAEGVFNRTQSAVMSHGGACVFHYKVFDFVDEVNLNTPFEKRLEWAYKFARAANHPLVTTLNHDWVNNRDELEAAEAAAIESGYEGLMLRDPLGRYKCNRSTLREGILIKLKRFEEAEARVTGWEPLLRNENEAITDARGYTKRSSHQAGKIVDDSMVGKIHGEILNGKFKGCQVTAGSGFDEAERLALRKLVEDNGKPGAIGGRVFTFKFQAYGSKNAPRIAIWKGFRPELDNKMLEINLAGGGEVTGIINMRDN